MTKAVTECDKSIDVSNHLKQSVDLLHIQYSMLDRIVEYAADKAKDKHLECILDDMVSLNQVIMSNINRQSDIIVDRAINKLRHNQS